MALKHAAFGLINHEINPESNIDRIRIKQLNHAHPTYEDTAKEILKFVSVTQRCIMSNQTGITSDIAWKNAYDPRI